jgi:hypothetical protein
MACVRAPVRRTASGADAGPGLRPQSGAGRLRVSNAAPGLPSRGESVGGYVLADSDTVHLSCQFRNSGSVSDRGEARGVRVFYLV